MSQKQDPAKRMQTTGILLLVALFGAWLYYQSYTQAKLAEQQQQSGAESGAAEPADAGTAAKSSASVPKLVLAQDDIQTGQAKQEAELTPTNGEAAEATPKLLEQNADMSPIVVETQVYRAELSPQGAVLRSLVLKQHSNNGEPLEMVRSVDSGLFPFLVYLGDYKDGQAIDLPFAYEKTGPLSYRFQTEFRLDGQSDGQSDGQAENQIEAEPYILEKTIEFSESDYMIKVSVRLQHKSGKLVLPQNARGIIYSLYYGPQIGPEVDHIGKNRTSADTRSYVYFNGKKSKTISLARGSRDKRLDSSPIWAGISGKYFGVFGLPSRNLDVYWSGAEVSGLGLDASGSELDSSQFLFERQAQDGDTLAYDTFYYYIGPLLAENLSVFNQSSDNDFGLSDASLNSLVKFSLGFIEAPIKWILTSLYSFTHNYGIAIIIFAIIVRLMLYPLTLKAFKSTSRMRFIQPQMKELQERHKGDPKRLQQEMAALYRKEKVNPMGGCLPLLIQMPILIAIANLFYRYFELRGATFIPGWIGDLSVPDLIYTLDLSSWTIPLRLLPIIYLASQLISSKLMQASQPPMQNKLQQRMFTVYMPILFSVILYNMPSGLILYWTISNILMTTQQLLQTRFLSTEPKKEEHDTAAAQSSKNYRKHVSKRDALTSQNDKGNGNNKTQNARNARNTKNKSIEYKAAKKQGPKNKNSNNSSKNKKSKK